MRLHYACNGRQYLKDIGKFNVISKQFFPLQHDKICVLSYYVNDTALWWTVRGKHFHRH